MGLQQSIQMLMMNRGVAGLTSRLAEQMNAKVRENRPFTISNFAVGA